MRKHSLSKKLFFIAVLLPFGGAIAYLYYLKGAALDSFIYGSSSWGLGCILKLIFYHVFVRKLRHEATSILGVSTLNGLVSGVTELGLALAFFAFLQVLSLWNVVAFEIGIGKI